MISSRLNYSSRFTILLALFYCQNRRGGTFIKLRDLRSGIDISPYRTREREIGSSLGNKLFSGARSKFRNNLFRANYTQIAAATRATFVGVLQAVYLVNAIIDSQLQRHALDTSDCTFIFMREAHNTRMPRPTYSLSRTPVSKKELARKFRDIER